ncbi:quinon protein alcohol dehydrogenase-like superfamily [Flagelloscypha sp. PMI_526]|nr:quinon protein alcohol dehydrogenase-like superfamily [Flagelloscypha sp. PMI_526]
MLLKQPEDGSSPDQIPNFEDDRDVPTVDEHLQAAGAEAFRKFQKKVNNLDKEVGNIYLYSPSSTLLRNFANAARQLGSSVAILSSASSLRFCLAHLLFLYHENAADLFPRKIQRYSPTNPSPPKLGTPSNIKNNAGSRVAHAFTPTVDAETLDLEDFPDQFDLLAQELTTFTKAVNDFPEFLDDGVNISINSFVLDLRYWASCLRAYHGQFRYPAVQRYVQDLTLHMGDHIDHITTTLSTFVEVGVPTIRFAQKHGAENLLNLSTVSTFFSGITATAVQESSELEWLAILVNCFWFASMVFSISAAVNSLLGLTWKQAMYRSPRDRVPWWVLIWIKRSPLVFLVLSVACFSIGLCCFAYASNQHKVTSALTTVLTAITSFGLLAVSIWFASERAIFLRHEGKKWLSDALQDINHQFLELRGMRTIRHGANSVHKAGRRASVRLRSINLSLPKSRLSTASPSTTDEKDDDDLEAGVLPVGSPDSILAPHDTGNGRVSRQSPAQPRMILSESTPSSPQIGNEEPGTQSTTPTTPKLPSRGKELWRNALKTIAMSRSPFASPVPTIAVRKSGMRKQTAAGLESKHGLSLQTDINKPGRLRSRIHALGPRLEMLDCLIEFDAHQALWLATSSWDRTAIIFKVTESFTAHRTLAHPQGFVGQVAWSPDSTVLLTKLSRGIKVWNAEDGVCTKTIIRNRYVESITWCPGGQAFLSVEGSHVVKLGLQGEILAEYDFGAVRLHDVAITPDQHRLLAVGPLLESPSGLHPSTSRAEKRLIVYNTETHHIENQTPVLNDVRDITISRNMKHGLAPPQLWKVDLVKDRESNAYIARFSLRHTYPSEINCTSYFGGINDDLVLCAGKAGDIHIWDTDSGSLLHKIRSQALGGGDLTCIAWNHAVEHPFMFATGSHDGTIRIWSHPPDTHDDLSPGPSGRSSIRRENSPYGFEETRHTESPEAASSSFLQAPVSILTEPPPMKDRVVTFVEEGSDS